MMTPPRFPRSVWQIPGIVFGLVLVFTGCGASVSKSQGRSPVQEINGKAAAAQILRDMDARTPDDPARRAFLAEVAASIDASLRTSNTASALSPSSCGCPGSGASRGFSSSQNPVLSLDESTDPATKAVGSMCNVVDMLASRTVPNDGGCWLRANAVCIAGLASGLEVRKIWIVGDVRDAFGGIWNFHVANVYDGRVYDVGFGLHGISLEEWQQKFSGDVSKTEIIVANCSSYFGSDGLEEAPSYTPELVEQICQASGAHGGRLMYAQMSSWIREAARFNERVPAAKAQNPQVVPAGAQCADVLSPVEHTFEDLAKASRPKFSDHNSVSAACQEKVYFRALEALDDYTRYRYTGHEVTKVPAFGHKVTLKFLNLFEENYEISALVDSKCEIRTLLETYR